jgi:hypothetical protein
MSRCLIVYLRTYLTMPFIHIWITGWLRKENSQGHGMNFSFRCSQYSYKEINLKLKYSEKEAHFLKKFESWVFWMYCHMFQWLKTGFAFVIGFINHLQVVTIIKCNIVTDFHTTNHSTLIFSVYFHQFSVSVSWQRIYNTGNVKVLLHHTLPISLYYRIHKIFKPDVRSSQAYI